MEPFTRLKGTVAPLSRVNVDTDQIIPKQFLKRIERTGFGEFAFFDWRYKADGSPDPDFELNRAGYEGASILVTGRNFGCGSSREHAPQAIRRWGIRTIVGESFSEIFFGNAVALGMPCVTAADDAIDALMRQVEQDPSCNVRVSLADLRVIARGAEFPVEMPSAARQSFLNATWDATGLLLDKYEEVEAVARRLPYLNGWS